MLEQQQQDIKLPETVWDEYDGQHVFIQLKAPYYAVTSPGVPAKVQGQNGAPEFLLLPILSGTLRLKKDQQGDVRITMLVNDPDERKQTKVRMDFEPSLIAYLSVTPLESKIVAPQ